MSTRHAPPLPSRPLTRRVRLLLRVQMPNTLPALSDREAIEALKPYGQGVKAAPANCPLNEARPQSVLAGGRADEQEFGSSGNLTG